MEQTEFISNWFKSVQELRHDEELFDVTIACGDGDETIEAHKVVLSACSPFFRQLFRKAKQSYPLIYLRGILITELSALMEYIYTGQTQVLAEDVNKFIRIAQDLKINGLADEIEESSCNEKNESGEQTLKIFDDIGASDNVMVTDSEASGNQTLIKEISNRMEKVKHEGDFLWKCTECGFRAKTKTKLGFHVETHLDGFTHTCLHCGKEHKTRVALKQHINNKHKNPKKELEQDGGIVPDTIKLEIHQKDDKVDSLVPEESLVELDGSINDSLFVLSESEKLQNENLRSEISKRMEKFEDSEQGSMWKCIECGKVLKKKLKLEGHVETHLEGFTHTCTKCGKIHKTRAALKMHLYTIHKPQ